MRSRINKQAEDPVPAWQTIYCSLVLIMLILFVMLVSYSATDRKKLSALKSNFAGYQEEERGEKERARSVTLPMGRPPAGAAWEREALVVLQQAGMKPDPAGDVSVEKMGRGLKFQMKGDAMFPPGQAGINKQIYPYLDQMIKVAKARNLFVSIEGHTDDAPVRNGVFSSNWELSAARAMNVLRYCLEKGKIPAGRLSATGFASYRPLVHGDTPQGRMQNRRIEIFLTKEI